MIALFSPALVSVVAVVVIQLVQQFTKKSNL
jgi:hypothetical protein